MKALITCSGFSNTGKLTTQAAMLLTSRSSGVFMWVQATKDEGAIAGAVENADRIIVLEGCCDHCAMKKLNPMGIKPDIHIVATDLGIGKNGMADVQWEEVEKMLAVLKQKLNGEA